MNRDDSWPSLPYHEWKETCATLHMWTQIVGKIRAALGDREGVRWDEPGSHAEPIRSALCVLQPFIERADLEGECLGRYAADLAAACGLAQMARLADPDGALDDELARLLGRAAE